MNNLNLNPRTTNQDAKVFHKTKRNKINDMKNKCQFEINMSNKKLQTLFKAFKMVKSFLVKEQKYELAQQIKEIEDGLNPKSNSPDWFDLAIYECYLKEGISMRELGKKTQIPVSTIYKSIKKVREIFTNRSSTNEQPK